MNVIVVKGHGRIRILSEDSSQEKIQSFKEQIYNELGQSGVPVRESDIIHYTSEVL